MATDLLDVLVGEPEPKRAKGKAPDPLDALADPGAARPADRPGPVLAEWYEEPEDKADRPKYLGELPKQPENWRFEKSPETGNLEYVEGKGKVRAVFTDQPNAGEGGRVSAQALAKAKPDTERAGKQALMGGALQGATFEFAEELAAAAAAPFSDQSYRELRAENRAAFEEAEKGDPKAYTTGHLFGGAATVLAPSIGMAGAGKPLLSLRNVGIGAGFGAAQAAGESRADLTKGEVGPFALDVAKGAGAGAAATAALGGLGKGASKVGKFIGTAPERLTTRSDDELWQLIAFGAPKPEREAMAGALGADRSAILDMVRANPAFVDALKRGDRRAAAEMVLAAQPVVEAQKHAALAGMEATSTTGERRALAEVKKTDAFDDPTEANRYTWTREESFPTRNLVKGSYYKDDTPESWAKWFKTETRDDPAYYNQMADDYAADPQMFTPIVAVRKSNGDLKVLDGNHRLGIAFSRNMDTVPVLIGEARASEARAIAGRPIIAEMEKRRDALRAIPTPENMAAAKKWQDRIDALNEKWMPEPKPPELKGPALVSRLTAGAEKGGKERAGLNADDFATVAQRYKLGKDVDDVAARQAKIDAALEPLNEKTAAIYDGTNRDIYIANVSGKLREWSDELRKKPGGMRLKDADNIDAMAANVAQAAANAGKPTMTPKELREFITNVQGKAFSGSYVDPTEARAMQRELASRLRGILDEHVATHGSKADVAKLAKLNKAISTLLVFKDSADAEAQKLFEGLHKAAPVVAGPAKTGKTKVRELYDLIQATDDPEAKRLLTGELYRQIGPESTQRLTGIERQEDLLGRLGKNMEAAANYVAGDNQRGRRLTHLFSKNNPISSVIAKYSDKMATKLTDYAAIVEKLRRRGASVNVLRTAGRLMGLTEEAAEDVLRNVAPREAGHAVTKERK